MLTSGQGVAIAIAVVAEVLAAVLAAIESAITRTSPVRARELADEGRKGGAALVAIAEDAARYINAVLLTRYALSVLAVVLVTAVMLAEVATQVWAIVLATAVMVVANFILLGVAARTMGQQHSIGLALRSAGLVRGLAWALAPATKILILVGNAVTPGKGFSEGPFASEAEIRALLDRAGEAEVLDPAEHRMLESVFELGDTLCRELMVPRTEMVFIERHKRVRQSVSLALRSGFSRIPVVGESLDDVVGVVNVKDLMALLHDQPEAEQDRVSEHMRPALLAPDIKRADEMLRLFQTTHTHLAVLVDEYGGTAGLVTVEDILEEIVGEISDEYDRDEIAECLQLGPHEWRVSSRMPVSDLADITGLDLSEDEDSVETVAGLVGRRLGVVPIPGSEVSIDGFLLIAETAEGRRNRVSTVRVSRVGVNHEEKAGSEE